MGSSLFWPGFFCTGFGVRSSLSLLVSLALGKESNCVSLNSSPGEARGSETLSTVQLCVLLTPCCLSNCGHKCLRHLQSSPEHLRPSKEAPPVDMVLSKPSSEIVGESEGSVWSFPVHFSPSPKTTNSTNSTPTLCCLNTPPPLIHTTSPGWGEFHKFYK